MFAHQDMGLGGETWLEDAERILNTIPDLGIAGVAGTSVNGSNWDERCRHSLSVLDENWDIAKVENTEEVQTLDECLLLVHQSVFCVLKFDDKVFDGWDCYGTDYCLAVKTLGKKAYVIQAGDCSHHTSRANYRPFAFRGLLKYQKALYKKYKNEYKTIYSWMGTVSRAHLRFRACVYPCQRFIHPFGVALFPDFGSILYKELSDCDSFLDLGCGASTFRPDFSDDELNLSGMRPTDCPPVWGKSM